MALEDTHYHVGIVVDDLESAAAQLSDLLGVEWGSISEVGQMTVRGPDGHDRLVPLRCVYSTQSPRLELIEEVPGSIWVRNEHSNLHHIGLWADGLVAESDRLTAMQCPLQLAGVVGGEAPKMWAYHGGELGVRIELVDAALRPTMEQSLFIPPST
jgi:hypothetical protein